ncbi:spermidine/putrescine transport system permease protein [Tistlia consotensis]|uniref:Spermidine/putrescine transport system permease protein n=1 Tax=Tistlia consotensis USBA 355 TaxID=560819 RepID=A0A1Y6CIS2_9PROT|nr:ABC transporter permease [Tistlia consotensis]SMF65333.1 spermidine/putrescine transport system permease protein [Tistlia consotensis USBA 355]SNS03890.1 spermidine/putrescine transport system permease protein [Tistlia consotensis]
MAAETASVPATSAPAETERLRLAKAAIRRGKLRTRWLLLSPALLTIVLVGLLPLSIILVYSFLEPGTYGGVRWVFSTDAYVQFLFERDLFEDTLTFNPAYLEIFWRSVELALLSTVGSLLIGFPTAYFIATRPPSRRNLWLFLITLPFWTNLLIRTFAMMLILRDEGVINIILMKLGLIDQPLVLIYTDGAVFLGLVYSYLPFMVLPIYAALEKLDFRLVEAAYDLYATRGKVLRHVILPVAKPGLVAGCILVFVPGLGAYITPELLGGGKSLMIGNMIAIQFGNSRNWPFGSAASLILMAIVLVALLVYVRYAGRRRGHG